MANEGIITLNDLRTRFSAAGVYTVYRDQTVSPNVRTTPILRLVYGFSRKGIRNVPVFIEQGDFDTAGSLFGTKIDKSLERKGSYFHRSLFAALEDGPVLALNLLSTNDETQNGVPTADADTAEYRSFSTDVADTNGIIREKLFASYFNKERFWKPSPSYLLATRDQSDEGSILNLTNLSQEPVTFIVRKSDVEGFDVTVKDWYADEDEDIPPFLNPHDLIEDYFIDVIAIRGDFGPDKYEQLAIDPVFGQFFDSGGLIIDETENFLARPEVTVENVYTGALIPNFRDKNNTSQYIETIINRETRITGILAAVDREELDKFEDDTNTKYLDLVGHRLLTENVVQANFLSYKKKIKEDLVYTKKTSNDTGFVDNTTGITVTPEPQNQQIKVVVDNSNPNFSDIENEVELGTLFYGETTAAGTAAGITVSEPVLRVTRILKTTSQITFDITSPLKDGETGTSGSFVDLKSFSSVSETLATADYEITSAGSTGDTVDATVDKDGTLVVLGSYTVQSGDSIGDVATGLEADISANSGSHGFTSSVSGSTITVTAPTGSGADANTWVPDFDITGAVTGSTPATFSGGVTAKPDRYEYETENDRIFFDGTQTYLIGEPGSELYEDVVNGNLADGDKITDGSTTHYVKSTFTNYDQDYRGIVKIDFFTDSDLTTPITSGSAIDFGNTQDSDGFDVTDSDKLNIISVIGALNERFDATAVDSKTVRVDISNESDIKIGQYLVGKDDNDNPILTRIVSVKRVGSPTPTDIEIETANMIKMFVTTTGGTQIERYKPLTSFFDRYDLTTMDGFQLKPSHMPNGTNERMKELLSVMTDTNMFDALTDPDMIDFRYLVDTFNHGLEPQSKRQLSRLCKTRQTCLGILNPPSIEEFRDSESPRFTDTPTASDPLPTLNIRYIRDGGNLEESPDFLYTLPEEEDGASFVGFFTPNLAIRDDDGDEQNVPPAAHVSNNFMRKFRGGNPFQPAAGPRRGVITGDGIVGVEYPFTQDERGLLQQKGLNPIYQKRNGDVQIMGNETSFKKFNSSLNNLNVRDTLITLTIDIENILRDYVFEFNDDSIRTEIRGLLDNYLGSIQNGFGAIQSYDIVFDRNNNPNFVVRENAAIVDTIVTPADVSAKFINRITLRRDAPPSVGGFLSV